MIKKIRNQKKRNGFALIYAILVMIIIAFVGGDTLYLINKTQSMSIQEYIKNQMQLYMSSTIEYTLLWQSKQKNNSNQNNQLKIIYPNGYTYLVNITAINPPVEESKGISIYDIRGIYPDFKNNVTGTNKPDGIIDKNVTYKFDMSKRVIEKP